MIRDLIREQGRFGFVRIVLGGAILCGTLVFGFPLAALIVAAYLGVE